MRTLVMPVCIWCLMFHSMCGGVRTGYTAALTIGIGRCSLNLSLTSLMRFHICLCAGSQTCKIQPRYSSWSAESHGQKVKGAGERTDDANSSTIHYMCEVTCRRQEFLNCSRVKSNESESNCKEGPKCNNIRLGFTGKYCERCIDIRWSKPDVIKAFIGNHDILQHGQCPRESAATSRSTPLETSVDLSVIFSNGSAVESNATTSSVVFPSSTLTEESESVSVNGSRVRLIIILLVLAIFVFGIAATVVCIRYRRRCKRAVVKHYTDTYITPLDVTYGSSESLTQGPAGRNWLVSDEGLHSAALDRSSHIYLAMENEYAVSFPDSCSRGPVQTPAIYTGAYFKTSVHENAERENVYTDMEKTAKTKDGSSNTSYANICSFLPNNSSTIATTSHIGTDKSFSKDKRFYQAPTDESHYSTINDCATTTDITLKHCSSICENALSVCNDVEGAYKIMKPTTTNRNDNTKNSHDYNSSGATLFNSMYTRLRENPEQVSNLYDDLVTEPEDVLFKSAFLSSNLGSENEYISIYCPLHKKQCSEEDCLNGNVYENHNSGPNVVGGYINNAMVSDAMRLQGINGNCDVEDKTLEPGSPYVNYIDPEAEDVPSLSTRGELDALTNKHILANGYSTVKSCAGNNIGTVCSRDDREKYLKRIAHS